jgi:hypothetical protein
MEIDAQTIEIEYARPEIIDHGDFAEITSGQLHDPIDSGPHGGPHFDPHLTHSAG